MRSEIPVYRVGCVRTHKRTVGTIILKFLIVMILFAGQKAENAIAQCEEVAFLVAA